MLNRIEVLEVTTNEGEVLLFERTEETTATALVEEYGAPLSIKYHSMTPMQLVFANVGRNIARLVGSALT